MPKNTIRVSIAAAGVLRLQSNRVCSHVAPGHETSHGCIVGKDSRGLLLASGRNDLIGVIQSATAYMVQIFLFNLLNVFL